MSSGAEFDMHGVCPACDAPCEPWHTTCARCDLPLTVGTVSALSGQLAPPLSYQPHVETWINLPVGAEDPVKAALLRSFLTEHEFDYAESPHFISIRETDARSVEAALSIWAYRGDMPEDHRHLDSLMSTLAELGDTTLAAIRDAILTSAADGTTDLDLR